jgi:hypothetical protein
MRREFYCTLWSDLFSCLIHCLYFFGLVAGKRSLDDNEKKEYMGDMKVDEFGRKVRLRQLLNFWPSRRHVSYFRYVVIAKTAQNVRRDTRGLETKVVSEMKKLIEDYMDNSMTLMGIPFALRKGT